MHRARRGQVVLLVLGFSAVGTVLTPTAAMADKPSRGCEHSTWTASTYPVGWQPGEDFDPVGANTIWQATLTGLVSEFGSLDAAAAALGVDGIDGFAQLSLQGYLKYDKNGDGTVCWKYRPDSQPAYYFNAVDNVANAS